MGRRGGVGREEGMKKLSGGVRTRLTGETTYNAKHFTEEKQDIGTLNEEKQLRWGEGCRTTAKFPAGCPSPVLPPSTHSTLRKNDIGSIFS